MRPQPARALPPLPALAGRRARGPPGVRCGGRWSGRSRTTAWSGLEPSPELAEAAYRIFLAQQRVALAVARRWPASSTAASATPTRCPRPLRKELRETLDRLVAATQLRHPRIGELARSVALRRLRPAADRGGPRARLPPRARRAGAPGRESRRRPGRAQLVDEVVATSQPLLPILAERTPAGSPTREPMLEVLTRRYYKIRALRDLRLAAAWTAGSSPPPSTAASAATCGSSRPSGRSTTSTPSSSTVGAVRAATCRTPRAAWPTCTSRRRGVRRRTPWPSGIERAHRGRRPARRAAPPRASRWRSPGGAIEQFTFRPDDGRLREERVVRGLHPMIAAAAALLAAFANFDVERVPSVGRGHLPLPLRRAGEPDRRAVRGAGRGARPDAGA